VREEVNQLVLRALFLVRRHPEADDFHAVLLEKPARVVAEARVERLQLAGRGVIGAQLEAARVFSD